MEPLIFATIILVAVLIFLVLIRSIMRAYVKTPANRAFVRTGGLFRKPNEPPKVVMNGGAWVFHTIHEIIWVDLGTMAIEIERTEHNALLTIDPQYADIKAIFYIKVNPTVEGIIDAARTIGGKQVDANAVKQLVDAKLDGALRDVAASFTLMSLHQEREKFIQEVQNRLKTDLEENGLVLEAVSILTLRAARQGSFGTDDVFGAQVARANAQVIQQALRERNDIERRTEIEVKQRDTDTAKLRLTLDRELALASATQEREVRTIQASEKAQADQKVYEEEQKSELARVAKERAVALTELERDQQLAIQNERRQQEVMAAEVTRRQAIELAEQQRQINVLQEQQKRENAEKERLIVSAQREEAAQAVKTVEATQEAQREARIRVIEAEREAQKAVIEQKNKIELEALRKQREAEAQAKALKEIAAAEAEAALKQAETLRTQAQAEREAETLRADGARAKSSAEGLAEAEVMKAKAESAMREAEAIRARGLAEAESEKAKAEALAAFEGVAQRVELTKLQLDAQVRIEIAKAQALGSALATMNIKLIGDPAAAASLLRLVTLADGLGEIVKAAPQPVREIGQQLINKVTGEDGDSLLKVGEGNGHTGMAELALLAPEIMRIAEQTLDVNRLKGQSVGEVLALLAQRTKAEDRTTIEKAQQALAALPIINDLPFEEVYLRATAK
ncbi:MAG TPA: SPFH domain-containing protein [Anaerolineae bacterium]|nr:SPFH domain-containing protein [Anaerolineae bacterium]